MRKLLAIVWASLCLNSVVWGDGSREALIKELNAKDYKQRKAAFEKALELPFDDLAKLIETLRDSGEPELEWVAKKLNRKYKQIRKTQVVPLPKGAEFKLNSSQAYGEYDYFRMNIEYDADDFSFQAKDISLLEMLIDGQKVEESKLEVFRSYSSEHQL